MGISVGFIHSPSFHKWSHLHVAWVFVGAIAQHTKEEFTFSHTHKTKTTNKIKINKKKIYIYIYIEKAKRREKENQQEKIEINKISKNKNMKRIKTKENQFFLEKKEKKPGKNKIKPPKFLLKIHFK